MCLNADRNKCDIDYIRGTRAKWFGIYCDHNAFTVYNVFYIILITSASSAE